MADIFPDEGLDWILGVVPKGGTAPANLYMLLFQGFTGSTVPGSTAVLATHTGVTEPSFTGYGRVTCAAAIWGTAAADTIWTVACRRVTGSQQTFPTATGTQATAIDGFGFASASSGGVGIYYSNFDDTTSIPSVAIGDVIKVTPKFGFAG